MTHEFIKEKQEKVKMIVSSLTPDLLSKREQSYLLPKPEETKEILFIPNQKTQKKIIPLNKKNKKKRRKSTTNQLKSNNPK